MARDDEKITNDEKDEKKYKEKHNQIPKHKNVIKNYVNFELFHKEDKNKEDCLGWVTVMEKADRTLRDILKDETNIDERGHKAEVIWSGISYLEKIGIKHFDFKLDNVLLLNGTPKIIDFGLLCETTGRAGYRKMGYCRRGSKFRISSALWAGTPGFAQQQQFAEGDGYNVDNFWYFLICDWETSWSLLYKPIEEDERKEIDKILKSCRATSVKKGIKEGANLNFSEIKTTISIPSFSSSDYCPPKLLTTRAVKNLVKTYHASNLRRTMPLADKPCQDLKNLTRNVIDQKDSLLCVAISVSILLRNAIEKDLQFEDKNGSYKTGKILTTLTLIVCPRSMAGLNYNPNGDEIEFQKNCVDILLERLCKKTYLMDTGWEIVRRIGPAGVNQPKKSTCFYKQETLNEEFKFTRPLTVTGAIFLPKRRIDGVLYEKGKFYHQMTLDSIDNPDDYAKAEYVIVNNSFKQGGPVVKIPLRQAYYEWDPEKDITGKNLVNYEKGNMRPNIWYLLPQAFSITLTPE